MWPELFKYDAPDGRKLAIGLMDTQGIFDNKSTTKENSTIFALSAMLSSVIIFNIMQNIQEDDLQYLQLFVDYGSLALKSKSKGKPFQRLSFLVRDWQFPRELKYGPAGGDTLLKNKLNDINRDELKSVRDSIKSCFEMIDCFLMAPPGEIMNEKENFDGRLADLSPKFKECLKELVPFYFAPQQLSPKVIDRQVVTCSDVPHYIRSYIKVFNSEDTPTPLNLLEVNIEVSNNKVVAEAMQKYKEDMQTLVDDKPFLENSYMIKCHEDIKRKVVDYFNSKPKMGGVRIKEKFLNDLNAKLEMSFKELKLKNHDKKTIYDNNCETHNAKVLKHVLSLYEEELKKIVDAEDVCLELEELESKNRQLSDKALQRYNKAEKKGLTEIQEKYRDELKREMEKTYAFSMRLNLQKLKTQSARKEFMYLDIQNQAANQYQDSMDKFIKGIGYKLLTFINP